MPAPRTQCAPRSGPETTRTVAEAGTASRGRRSRRPTIVFSDRSDVAFMTTSLLPAASRDSERQLPSSRPTPARVLGREGRIGSLDDVEPHAALVPPYAFGGKGQP